MKSRRLVRRVIWTTPESKRIRREGRALRADAATVVALAKPPGRTNGAVCKGTPSRSIAGSWESDGPLDFPRTLRRGTCRGGRGKGARESKSAAPPGQA